MAVDTVNKRRAIAGFGPVPDGIISKPDRRQIAGFYPYSVGLYIKYIFFRRARTNFAISSRRRVLQKVR